MNVFTLQHLCFHNTHAMETSSNIDLAKKDRAFCFVLRKHRGLTCHLPGLSVSPAAHFHTGTLLFMKDKQEDTSSRFCGKASTTIHCAIAQYHMS